MYMYICIEIEIYISSNTFSRKRNVLYVMNAERNKYVVSCRLLSVSKGFANTTFYHTAMITRKRILCVEIICLRVVFVNLLVT